MLIFINVEFYLEYNFLRMLFEMTIFEKKIAFIFNWLSNRKINKYKQ